MECPNQDCKDKVDKHDRTLFGKDGLVVCVSRKVTWKGLALIAVALLGMLGAPLLYTMAAEKKQSVDVSKNHTEIEVVKKDIEAIKEDVAEMKESQHRMESTQHTILQNQVTPEMLKRIVEDAVEKGNNP